MKETILIAALLAAPAALAQTDQPLPDPQFQIEDADAGDTRVWLSGLAFGLSGYGIALDDAGRDPLFCPPGDLAVDTAMLVEILNEHAADETLSAEAATVTALQGLQTRFPCRR